MMLSYGLHLFGVQTISEFCIGGGVPLRQCEGEPLRHGAVRRATSPFRGGKGAGNYCAS